jgi:hypothetical protein
MHPDGQCNYGAAHRGRRSWCAPHVVNVWSQMCIHARRHTSNEMFSRHAQHVISATYKAHHVLSTQLKRAGSDDLGMGAWGCGAMRGKGIVIAEGLFQLMVPKRLDLGVAIYLLVGIGLWCGEKARSWRWGVERPYTHPHTTSALRTDVDKG